MLGNILQPDDVFNDIRMIIFAAVIYARSQSRKMG